ncbi:hypothetical protein BV25DRAFT_1913052 [Artomyces pyxidatus]|uniref:Uncharacterized protein n=1 Tax=Artomyces pyxidatus TaxID=48021 RepID=A0ACB8TCW5_9AGAM|nr:hypothetical protein BV25DRAFT_1913052 [Artomyces pyxidatus]
MPSAKTLIWRDVLRYPQAEVTGFETQRSGSNSTHGPLDDQSRSWSVAAHGVVHNPLHGVAKLEGRFNVLPDHKPSDPSVLELEKPRAATPLYFCRPDGTPGLPLHAALSADAHLLLHSERRVAEHSTSIELKIGWRGYAPWADRVHLRTRSSEPVTLAMLVRRVAEKVELFMKSSKVSVTKAYPEWNIGSGPCKVAPADVIVIGVVTVSEGSIEPILQLR